MISAGTGQIESRKFGRISGDCGVCKCVVRARVTQGWSGIVAECRGTICCSAFGTSEGGSSHPVP